MAAPLSGLNEPRPLHSLSLGPGLELTFQASVCQCSGSELVALMLQEEHRVAGTKVEDLSPFLSGLREYGILELSPAWGQGILGDF